MRTDVGHMVNQCGEWLQLGGRNVAMLCVSGIRTGLLATCALGSLGLPSIAMAQTTQTGDASGEIIVTALKQNEALLDTPATVKVLDEAALEVASVTNAQQLSGIVPGYFSMQGVTGHSASIRGLGSNSPDPSIESSVAVFMNGVYLGHARDFTLPLYDTQQIEFISGAQSTLLGRNTSLGALAISTKRPGSSLGFELAGTYTSELDSFRFDGAADVPLGGGFALRAAFLANLEQGHVRNTFLQRSERERGEASGRLTLRGPLGNTGSLTVIYQRDYMRTEGQGLELFSDPNGRIAATAARFGQTVFDAVGNDITYIGSLRINPANPSVSLPFDDQDGDRATLIVEKDVSSNLKFFAQTAYVNWTANRLNDIDFTAFRLIDISDKEDNEVISQEVRLASAQPGPFTFNVGGLFYWNKYGIHRVVASDLGISLNAIANTRTESWSIFSSGRFELSEQFALTGGIRQTWESKTVDYNLSGSLAKLPGIRTLPAQDNSETDGNVGLEFRPQENVLLYASWARGSKNGGFQTNPDSLASAAYGPEATYNKEIGVKFDFGGRSFIELAVFDTIVRNFQAGRLVIRPPSTLPETLISNADARSTGAEISTQWVATDALQIKAGLTYADARFTEEVLSETAPGVFTPEIYPGMTLPRAPKWMGQVGLDYSAPISDRFDFSASGLIRYASTADLQFRSTAPTAPKATAGASVDVKLKIADKEAGWSLSLLANNLTDRRITTFTSFHLLDRSAFYGTRSLPRTFAVQLGLAL
jgi:outer membrane receptor protein involved in Fe transport